MGRTKGLSNVRFDVTTIDWGNVVPRRSLRPSDFHERRKRPPQESPQPCPFCPGNESLTPPEIFAIRVGGAPDTSAAVPKLLARVEFGFQLVRRYRPAREEQGKITRTVTRVSSWPRTSLRLRMPPPGSLVLAHALSDMRRAVRHSSANTASTCSAASALPTIDVPPRKGRKTRFLFSTERRLSGFQFSACRRTLSLVPFAAIPAFVRERVPRRQCL